MRSHRQRATASRWTPRTPAWSALERLKTLDFAAYGDDELRRAELVMERLARRLPRRLRRRLAPARWRAARCAAHADRVAAHGGVPLRRAWRGPRARPFKLVLVLDVSGSMRAYSRPLVMFAHAAVRADRHVAALTFGTRLTRVTQVLAERRPDAALAAAARLVPDGSGGTRIGRERPRAQRALGPTGPHARRDRRVPVRRLGARRSRTARGGAGSAAPSRALVWANPLVGRPGYQPLAAGMAAALPHLDRLLAGHDLASHEALVDVVCSLAAGVGASPRSTVL